MEQPLSLQSFPRAFLHIDADAFFASCEQAVNPALKGKPIITGKERGIASAVSYEAKALGIKRGMSIREIKQICPGIIHLPSDYETYSLFSKRMFSIVRRYTALVEEYSIDECFAEITGLRRPLRMTYIEIAQRIKHDLETELGITFSLGLAPTKVVAKIGSKLRKPAGLVVISGKHLHEFLANVPIGDVWGIGEQTTAYLAQFGIKTALDFARRDERWIAATVTKPHREIWHELRGTAVLPLELEEKHDYKSISKTKTFTPPTSERAFILAQLSKNTENACIKARRHGLAARRVFFLLRTEVYRHVGYEIRLSRPTALPQEIVALIDAELNRVYSPHERYRLTGVVLSDLIASSVRQMDLFGDTLHALTLSKVYDAVDAVDRKYGKHTVFLGSSFKAIAGQQHCGERAESARRSTMLFRGECPRRRLGIPMLGEVR
ncbi:MAG: DNA polymerase IV [bacterium]|nr:DNA polymerase IV [bacterium]MDZ4284218.1 DNA polymerase IV [Patescibacteria group bacterium]